MTPHRLSAAARTEIGLVRENNEDAVRLLPEEGVVVLADGIGGHKAGEVASEMAVQGIAGFLVDQLQQGVDGNSPVQAWLPQAVAVANRAILDMSKQFITHAGMGTTVVAGLFIRNRLFYAHVGDSRLYLLRNGRLTPLTRDHTMLQSLMDSGLFKTAQEARAAGISSSQLTRGVGLGVQVDVECSRIELEPDDTYLFCSDGLTNMVTDGMLGAVIQESLPNLSRAADLLLELALEQGGTDNISLALVRPDFPPIL
ncbi:MAG: protein phosphatase 2C domain-containing protein [Candidatus Polarisedimenticolaceae bacterium]|nr:protein phosphatase 2C domain-containing protein [Candidatus Polarisedimenticolaceae bacterium]